MDTTLTWEAAGVEEPRPEVVQVQTKPELGLKVRVNWVEGFVKRLLGR